MIVTTRAMQTNGQQVLGTHEQPARAYSWGSDPETIYKQSTDPAAKIPGMPPNMGELMLPQVTTFQGILSSVSRVYRPSDEALKHSFDNARFMLNDLVVTECIDQRRRSVCLLNWHLEPEDGGDARQKQLCADLTDIIERIPNFLKYREALSYAIWYGRYACQHRYRWQQIKHQMRVTIDRWLPVNGDKLVFRYDDGTNDYDPDQIGIRVGAGYQTAHGVQRRWTEAQFNQVQPTDYGLAYFLNEWERPLLAIHRYLIEDGEYEDPMNAGRVQGLGIRSRIYWTWYQKQETLAWLTEYLERSSLGMEVWYYPWGNNEGLAAVKKSAEERIGQGRNIVFVPRPMGDNQDAYGMERIEPGMAGAEVIERIVKEYFGHLIKRYILGQTMTTEAVPGSLGSGQGDVHLDNYMQIVRYDATNLEETLTTDLVKPLQLFNFPWSRNVRVRFKIDTEAPDVEKKLAAWKDAYDMGMELKEEGLCDLIGSPKAEPGDVVLQNPEAAQGRRVKESAQAGGQGSGANFKGRSQVSLMGQDFIELMKILQSKSDTKQLGQELGVDGAQPERYRRAGAVAELLSAIEKAADETDREPSDAQRKAGNYRKGRFKLHGLDITLETPRGAIRRGTDRAGNAWRVEMPHHYGYIRQTESEADGDHVDVFVGPDPDSELVFVIDQQGRGGRFDEHKVMLGFTSEQQARAAYLSAYQPGWQGLKEITPLTIEQFKAWLADGDTGKPIAGQVTEKYARSAKHKPAAGQGDIFARDDSGRFAEHSSSGPRASIADEGFALTNRSTGKHAVAENHDKTRQTKLLDGLGALPGQKDLFAAGAAKYAADEGGERWITIGAHRGEDGKKHGGTPVKISGGKIVSGPQGLAGKTLKGLAKKKPQAELRRAISKASKEHGFSKRDLADAIEFVHGERRRIHDQREQAKEHARKLTGLTAADISRLSNAGHDYASGMKAGGVTGERLRHFDEFAQEMAREYPELGLGDPDSGSNTSQRLWDVLGEGKLSAPQKHHEDTVQEAVDLLHANARYAHDPEEEPIPFAADPHADPEDGERHRLEVPDRPLNDGPLSDAPVAVGGDGADLFGLLSAAFAKRGY